MMTLLPGLPDPVLDSQRVFRTVLDAMARPGTIVSVDPLPAAPHPLHPAMVAVLLTLADFETGVWLDDAAATEGTLAHLRFHCGASRVGAPRDAAFAVIADPLAMPSLATFAQGDDAYPDRSTTMLIQVPDLGSGPVWTLRGPGIRDHASLAVSGLPPAFSGWVRDNHGQFPCGVDMVFTCGERLVALPRSIRMEG